MRKMLRCAAICAAMLFCSTLKDIVPEELEESCYRWVVEEQRSGKSFWNPSDYYFSDIIKQKLGNGRTSMHYGLHEMSSSLSLLLIRSQSSQLSQQWSPTAEPEEVFFCSKVSGVPPIPNRRFQ